MTLSVARYHSAPTALRTPPRWLGVVVGSLVSAAAMGPGCGSPPSVVPLLELTRRTVLDEAGRLESDAEREARYLQEAKRQLARAYHADLTQRAAPSGVGEGESGVGHLDAEWVDEATRGYVLAHEEIVRAELAAKGERAARADNLRAAAEAQTRAIRLIQQQDRLLLRLTGGLQPRDLVAPLTAGPSRPAVLEPPTRRD